MKKRFLIILVFGLVTISVLFVWFNYRTPHTVVLIKRTDAHVDADSIKQSGELETKQNSVLNLALPNTVFLMDPKITLPDPKYHWRDLFTHTKNDSNIAVGGHLIFDEKEPDPNAAVWDQVKGAEVGITIKTP